MRRVTDRLDTLWQSLTVGELELRNRIFVPAHGMNLDEIRYADYLGARARGGASLLITGAVPVHPTTLVMDGLIEGWSESSVQTYRRLSESVQAHGSHLFVQLYHVGAQGTGRTGLDWQPVLAPSPVPSPIFGTVPKEMDAGDIEMVVDAFARAARLVRDSGADGVEIHGAHGYLIQQFLSPLTNLREDEYGGSVANRCRFALEVGRAVRRSCGPDFPVGLRIGLDGPGDPGGLTLEDAGEWLALIDAEELFDFVNVSGGNYGSLHQLVPPMSSQADAPFSEHARLARRVCRDTVPVLLAGTVRDLGRAAAIVADGIADAVGMVRAHLADPELVSKARSGRAGEIRRCVGANQGCWARALSGAMATCTVNPEAGREWELAAAGDPADGGRTVLVVGGGPAGMKAAESAAGRGHQVTLLEGADHLGGQLALAARLPRRARWRDAIDDLEASLERLGVEVRLSTRATPDLVAAARPDVAVVATGARWEAAAEGPEGTDPASFEGTHAIDPSTAILRPDACAARVVIVDDSGEYTSLGIAELLAGTGREVELLTRRPMLGDRLVATATAELPWVYPRLVESGVRMRAEATLARDADGGCRIEAPSGSIPLPRETTFVVFSRRAADARLAADLRPSGIPTVVIGDSLAPRAADDAFFEGLRCGSKL
ncbi:MAG TPA: FAD-dependent oxidoreductase [Solirubrobacterales bacterium]|nr:FAD-dependent oxidoreductase [Solirubrobacterales bacterium]